MKNWDFTLGVDVSKNTLDISCAELNEHIQIKNGTEGFVLLCKWCRQLKIDLKRSFFVMEYTGGYEYKLLQFCESRSLAFTRIPGLAIKNSLGISRGKNDKVDSSRIAQYGEEKHKQLKPSKPLNTAIISLKQLLNFRKRLGRENAGYEASVKEREHMYSADKRDIVIRTLEKKIKANEKYIAEIEVEMM